MGSKVSTVNETLPQELTDLILKFYDVRRRRLINKHFLAQSQKDYYPLLDEKLCYLLRKNKEDFHWGTSLLSINHSYSDEDQPPDLLINLPSGITYRSSIFEDEQPFEFVSYTVKIDSYYEDRIDHRSELEQNIPALNVFMANMGFSKDFITHILLETLDDLSDVNHQETYLILFACVQFIKGTHKNIKPIKIKYVVCDNCVRCRIRDTVITLPVSAPIDIDEIDDLILTALNALTGAKMSKYRKIIRDWIVSL